MQSAFWLVGWMTRCGVVWTLELRQTARRLNIYGVHRIVAATFALLLLSSSNFQVKPTNSLHTTTDKLSRQSYTLPCPMGGGSMPR